MLKLVLLAALCVAVCTIPIDNGVVGDPLIECGSTDITVSFNTQKSFAGNVYVKGLFEDPDCKVMGDSSASAAQIRLPFDQCNTMRTRSLNPRGIFVTAVVVISFHPLFLTKVDRAYRLQCFYMEADKTVSTQLEVSEITTAFQTNNLPMPICRYEIRDGSPKGEIISYATIGQQVYHKWTCDTETVNTFCMTVYSCYVESATGDKVEILDAQGCALDKHILNNLEYPADLEAGQEAHVYKFADKSQLFYQCQISISIKEPEGECPRPQCKEPQGFGAVQTKVDASNSAVVGQVSTLDNGRSRPGAVSRQRPSSASGPGAPGSNPYFRFRALRKRHVFSEETLDVSTDLEALDILVSQGMSDNLSDSRKIVLQRVDEQNICVPIMKYYLFFGVLFIAGVVTAMTVHLMRK